MKKNNLDECIENQGYILAMTLGWLMDLLKKYEYKYSKDNLEEILNYLRKSEIEIQKRLFMYELEDSK